MKWFLVIGLLLVLFSSLCFSQIHLVYLHELDLSAMDIGWSSPKANTSVDGNPLRIGGQKFDHGVGTHSISKMLIRLEGKGKRLRATVGIDEETRTRGSVEFFVLGDKKLLWRSGVMRGSEAPKTLDVDVSGIRMLGLLAGNGGDDIHYDHADWCDAVIELTEPLSKQQLAVPLSSASDGATILTPKPSDQPRINGPALMGVRPGSPFLYTIPVTGVRPMTFGVRNLPKGLSVDRQSGRITGRFSIPGEYAVTFTAQNKAGKSEKKFRIVVGDQIALTPPLGWNSWNCWAGAVDDAKVRSSAKAMAEKGLVDHGWTYINIDDTWQGLRGGKHHAIESNEKFPDMKSLSSYVHGLGLKLGIYSTPWITSYALFSGGSSDDKEGLWMGDSMANNRHWRHGKFTFEENDAKQWAEWEIDYLKYDWNPNNVEAVGRMGKALKNSGRDVVYSLSNSAPFEHAADWARLANCWRTTGDIIDTWSSMAGIGFSQDRWRPYGGTGHWNDPDMLVVGHVGWGPNLHPTRLRPDEQYTHISLWSLLSAPMLLGCDLARLDDFTLNLLTNDEVLEVNQDPLGKQAALQSRKDGKDVWVKEMEDGSKAVGLFFTAENYEDPILAFNWDGAKSAKVTVLFSDLGFKGKVRVRDLWRQKDLGVFENEFSADVPFHGVVLVRMWEEK